MAAFLVVLVLAVLLRTSMAAPDIDFCSSLVQIHGYPCLEYQVTTEDGYVLKLHRIPHGTKSQPGGQPVFLQHGILQGGDNWVYDPHENALGFILADRGYDVWIGNLRGSRWSAGHVVYSSLDKAYWQWSWDEHASYDLPAMLKFAHQTSGSKLYYVGHSQGTLIALAALSETNIVNTVKAAALLCPIAYLRGINSFITKLAASVFLDKAVDVLGNGQFTLQSGIGAEVIETACTLNSRCTDLLTLITGPNCCVNASLTSYYRKYGPQSTSTKNMVHFAQMVRTGQLAKFDYGLLGNLKAYRQLKPPAYDPSNIPSSLPLLLAFGGLDALATPAGVTELASRLNCGLHTLYLPEYAHLDFVVGTRANRDVYEPLLDFLTAH